MDIYPQSIKTKSPVILMFVFARKDEEGLDVFNTCVLLYWKQLQIKTAFTYVS